MMNRIWFEREMPTKFAPLLEGHAINIGPASANLDDPTGKFPDIDAIIASSIMVYDASIMDRMPDLKIISRTGIGYDKVCIPDATERGIAVCNAPDGPTISTAEHALALMLGVAKKIKKAERELRGGGKDFYKNHFGLELSQSQLGLVGLGRIGSRVAKMAFAFGMKVVAYDPYVPPEKADELGIEMVSDLNKLFETSDIVSLHLPLTSENCKFVDAKRLAQMKSGSILINTARGGLVDEVALLDALDSGHLSGVGLDVTDPEPAKPDNPLLHREDVIVTPHIGSATTAGKDRLYEMAIKQVLQYLKGKRPPHLINPEVWKG
jgi:D-3-phosphoglycerate dehydrogenase / 2-oxoglutarate reductase